MSERGIKSKSKNDTWSEEELSRHLMHKGSPETKLNKTSPDTYGSPKTQSKSKTSTSSRQKEKSYPTTSSRQKEKSYPTTSSSSESTKTQGSSSRRIPAAGKEEKTRSNPRQSSGAMAGSAGATSTGQKKEETRTTREVRRKEEGTSKERSLREKEQRGEDRGGRGGGDGGRRPKDVRGTGAIQSHSSSKPPGSKSQGDRQPSSSSRTQKSGSSSGGGDKSGGVRGGEKGGVGRSSGGGRGSERSRDKRSDRDSKKDERDRRREREDKKTDAHSTEEKDIRAGSSETKVQRSLDPHKSKDKHSTNSPKPPKKIVVHEDSPKGTPRAKDDILEEMGGGRGRGKALQPMVEVTEKKYKYSDEEIFESYEEDFDEDTGGDLSAEKSPRLKPKKVVAKPLAASAAKLSAGELELLALKQAMAAENELFEVSSSERLPDAVVVKVPVVDLSDNDEAPPPPAPTSRRFVDFSTAQKEDVGMKVAKRTKKRGVELLSLIEFDIVAYDMFDLPPLSEYEIYVKKFGTDGARQAAVQTGEDNREAEVQTRSIPSSDMWVQWPPEDLKGYGSGQKEVEVEEDGGYGSDGIMERGVANRVKGQSAVRLISFLKKAGQVCSVLLDENLAASGVTDSHTTESQLPFCTSCLSIQNIPTSLFGWYVNHAYFSPSQDHLILASYSQQQQLTSGDPHTPQGGVVCIWNRKDPVQPNIIMTCQAPVTCCCFSPQKASLAFAGGEDGSVILWDLREPRTMHLSHITKDCIGRPPTFSTAGIPQLANHQAPIVSISPVSSYRKHGTTSSPSSPSSSSSSSSSDKLEVGMDRETTGLSFQLATLDKSGLLKLWVIIELASSEPHGSDSDLGLVPGGRVKLVKSALVNLAPGPAGQSFCQIECHCLRFHPLDTNHIYVGTNRGSVYHHTRYGQRPIPRHFLPKGATSTTSAVGVATGMCDVTSISFSLHRPDYFLVGCSNGSIRIHSTGTSPPLYSWADTTEGVSVTTLQWVEGCPGVFLVLDASSNIYMWDLLENDSWPVFNIKLKSSVSFCTLTSSDTPSLLLAYMDGPLELHSIKPLSQLTANNREQEFSDYLSNLV